MKRLTIVKMSIFPNLVYKFNEILIKVPRSFNYQLTDFKFDMGRKKNQNRQYNTKEEK